jgi:acyl-CoA thioesterase FadM
MNQTFTKTQKIRFKHVDFAGIVFYPRFLEMLNDLVEDWFEEALDRPFSKIHQTNGIPTVDLKVQFKKQRVLAMCLKSRFGSLNSAVHRSPLLFVLRMPMARPVLKAKRLWST